MSPNWSMSGSRQAPRAREVRIRGRTAPGVARRLSDVEERNERQDCTRGAEQADHDREDQDERAACVRCGRACLAP